MNKKKDCCFSFTLIEALVVVAVISLTLPVMFVIFLTILRQQVKIYRLAEVKRQGDYVISVIDSTIRNSAKCMYNTAGAPPAGDCNGGAVCTPGAVNQPFTYFKAKNPAEYFRFYVPAGAVKIASESSILGASGDLTTNKVVISSFSTTCSRGSSIYSSPYINVQFSICYNTNPSAPSCSSSRPEETATLNYQSIIKLRNF